MHALVYMLCIQNSATPNICCLQRPPSLPTKHPLNHYCCPCPPHPSSLPPHSTGWWYQPDWIINDLNTNSAVARPWHDELLSLATNQEYQMAGYAYTGGWLGANDGRGGGVAGKGSGRDPAWWGRWAEKSQAVQRVEHVTRVKGATAGRLLHARDRIHTEERSGGGQGCCCAYPAACCLQLYQPKVPYSHAARMHERCLL
jgi:hypothetical protein